MEFVSEFKSCDNNPKKIYVDAEYCATLDHTAKPIGEYGEYPLIYLLLYVKQVSKRFMLHQGLRRESGYIGDGCWGTG